MNKSIDKYRNTADNPIHTLDSSASSTGTDTAETQHKSSCDNTIQSPSNDYTTSTVADTTNNIISPNIELHTDIQIDGTINTDISIDQLTTGTVNTDTRATNQLGNKQSTTQLITALPVSIARPIPTSLPQSTKSSHTVSNYFNNFVNTFGESSSRVSTSLLNGFTSIADTTKHIVESTTINTNNNHNQQHNNNNNTSTNIEQNDRRLSALIASRITPTTTPPTHSPKLQSAPSTTTNNQSDISSTQPIQRRPTVYRSMRIATVITQSIKGNNDKSNHTGSAVQHINTNVYIPSILLHAEHMIQQQTLRTTNSPPTASNSIPLHQLLYKQTSSAPNTVDNNKGRSVTDIDHHRQLQAAHQLFTAKSTQ